MEMLHEFVPIAKIKQIAQNKWQCTNAHVEIEENSEFDLFEAEEGFERLIEKIGAGNISKLGSMN